MKGSAPSPIELGPRDRVFVLTGAGISSESGIATFRDANGLWEQHRVEDVASPEGFARDPSLVWRFYSERRSQALECSPNAAHHALAKLESALGERLFVCTQNVDPLHEAAGSQNLVHMHGELLRSRCSRCKTPSFHDSRAYASIDEVPPCTSCGALIRPDIVWFGEVPFELERIHQELSRATVFVTIGSSGVVYPAAGFVRAVQARKTSLRARAIYVGPEAPENVDGFDEHRIGRASDIVPTLFG